MKTLFFCVFPDIKGCPSKVHETVNIDPQGQLPSREVACKTRNIRWRGSSVPVLCRSLHVLLTCHERPCCYGNHMFAKVRSRTPS
jgi:hypothetical protein